MATNFQFAHASTDEVPWDNQVLVMDWYIKEGNPWTRIFRPKDKSVAEKIVKCAIMICENQNVGYSMGDRYSLWQQICDHGFDPGYAKVRCHCDCSQFVSICLNYAGVPVPAGLYTAAEESILDSTGQFVKIANNVNDPSIGQPGDIYLRPGHTAICVSNTGPISSSNLPTIQSNSYQYTKYDLTDTQLSYLSKVFSAMLTSENGVKAVASVAANILENDSTVSSEYGKDIYKFVSFSKVFKLKNGTSSSNTISWVKDVLVNGNRVVPGFVDSFADIKTVKEVTNNDQKIKAEDRSFYIQDTTIISVDSAKKFKFWCFPDSSNFAFGYTNESLRSQWNIYLNHGTTQFADTGLSIDWNKLKPYLLYIDRNTRRKLDYADLMVNHGVIGVMIEGGSGFTIEGFRNPKCYDQARDAMAAGCPFGYVLIAKARTTKEANEEMENVRFLVSHYSPKLGVWVDLQLPGGKSRNNEIMKVYQRELTRYGLKNKIGIKCSRSTLDKSISWMQFQDDWRLWLVDPVSSVDELKKLIDPSFFDTDNESGPIRGANNAIFSLGVYNVGSYSGYSGGYSGNTQAVDMFELGDRCYNESSPDSAACQEWIAKVAEMVRWANRNHRVKASLVIVTIISESGWIHTPKGYNGDGHTLAENNNVMGINDYPELTTEDVAWATYRTSKMFTVSQWSADGSHIVYGEEKMKTYKCIEDCIEDFIGFMCKKHPEFRGNNNLEAYAGFLQGYTPNPNERTVDIRARAIARFGLEKYDNMDYEHFEQSTTYAAGSSGVVGNTASASSSSSSSYNYEYGNVNLNVKPVAVSESSDPLYSMPAGTKLSSSQVSAAKRNPDSYFKVFKIDDKLFKRITSKGYYDRGDGTVVGSSYKLGYNPTGSKVRRDQLRYIKVVHYNFNHQVVIGEIMVNSAISDHVVHLFKELFKHEYEINKMVLVDEYDADDDRSIADNNTLAFNFRMTFGSSISLSKHATGFAIDINPIQNPYLDIDHATGNYFGYDPNWQNYVARSDRDHMITHNDLAFKILKGLGWDWGGDWNPPTPKDYQHFQRYA